MFERDCWSSEFAVALCLLLKMKMKSIGSKQLHFILGCIDLLYNVKHCIRLKDEKPPVNTKIKRMRNYIDISERK